MPHEFTKFQNICKLQGEDQCAPFLDLCVSQY